MFLKKTTILKFMLSIVQFLFSKKKINTAVAMKPKQYLCRFIILQLFFIFELVWYINAGPIGYYFPDLNWQFNYTKKFQSNFSQVVKYQINNAKTYELYANNTFLYTNVEASIPYQWVLFNPSNTQEGSYFEYRKGDYLIDFSSEATIYWEVHLLLRSNLIITVQHNYNDIIQKYIANITGQFPIFDNSILEATNQTFYVINPGQNNDKAIIHRVLRTYNFDVANTTNSTMNTTTSEDIPLQTMSMIQGDEIRATVCKKYWQIQEYLVVWNISSYIQIYECDYTQCTLNATIPNNFGNSSWITDKINFDYDCNRILVQYDDLAPATTYDLSGNVKSTYTIDTPIKQFKNIGGETKEAAIMFPNGSYVMVSLQNNTFMTRYDGFGPISEQSRLVWYHRLMMLNYPDVIVMYRFQCWDMMYFSFWRGQCYNCSVTCTSCHQPNGTCITCIPDYQINPLKPKECIPIPPQPAIANITNSTTNSSIILPIPQPPQILIDAIMQQISNNTTAIILPQTISNSTNNTTPQPNNANIAQNSTSDLQVTQGYKYGAQYAYQEKTAQITLDSLDWISDSISYILKILQVFPLAWLFLNFINFWSICSFYVFLDVNLPEYFQLILKGIYDAVSKSILPVDDFAQKFYPISEKLINLREQFGISSSFVLMNMEPFILFAISFLMALMFTRFMETLPKESWFKKHICKSIELKEMVKNQFMATTPNYFLPFSLILYNFNKSFKNEGPNLMMHIIFIGGSLVFPFLFIGKKIEIKLKTKSTITLKMINKQKQEEKIEIIEWLYYSNCNTIVPFLCVVQWPYLFLPFGLVFFAFGIYVASFQEKFRINEIILASYRLAFHFFFTLIALFGYYSVPLKHHASIVCVLILFIGAIHELLTFFCSIIYFIYRRTLKNAKKVQDQIVQKKVHNFCNQYVFSSKSIKTKKTTIKFEIIDGKKLQNKKCKIKVGRKNDLFSTAKSLRFKDNSTFQASQISKLQELSEIGKTHYFQGHKQNQSRQKLDNKSIENSKNEEKQNIPRRFKFRRKQADQKNLNSKRLKTNRPRTHITLISNLKQIDI